jgi:class 3 adenylate cyclase/TolB-like protein/Tfp pilus assembly protein PilF
MEDRLPRKLAVILYADVAGYSRLTGDDEDATHRTLSEYLDLIAQAIRSHNGKVMHYAGDAVLAKFDAVVDALSSATDIQIKLASQNEKLPDERKVYFRIGVNLGDVIEDRGDIYGDGVNIAARLESLAYPGGICISEAVRSTIKKKFDLRYEEMGEQILKNIEEPVRAYRVLIRALPEMAPESDNIASEISALDFALPDRPSVAILPFRSLGADPDKDYLADGIRLGIQASLVQLSGLFLINAPVLNDYRGRDVSAEEAGKELGVKYILDGTVQQAGDRVRATVHLTDVKSGQAMWAETYDRILDNVFELQDEITKEVISSLNVKLLSREIGRVWSKKLINPEALQNFYRALSSLYEGTKEDNAIAREMFEELYRVQPDSVLGPSNISVTHWLDAFFNWTDSQSESYAQAEKWAKKAIEYEDNNGLGHAVLGHIQLLQGDFEEAIKTCSKSVELRSSCPLAHGLLGVVLNYNGNSRAAIGSIREALQLQRVYPPWLINFLATAYRDCGEVKLSITAAEESMRLNPNKNDAELILCADYKLAADHDQARSTAEQIIASNPSFSLASYAKSQPYKDPAQLDRVIGALREAGLPE